MRAPEKMAILALSLVLGWTGWRGLNVLLYSATPASASVDQGGRTVDPKVKKTEEEWKKELSPEEYNVMFQCGTEPPFSGRYNDFWEMGDYRCAACGTKLFSSEAKYAHGTGWPSFTAPDDVKSLTALHDYSHGMHRIEVRCANCGAHLGHVFDDGPAPNGKHYCINSLSMTFRPEGTAKTAAPSASLATFAAGCFWGIEDKFGKLPGVLVTAAGYSGGKTKNPTYQQVCSDTTGHAEAVQVTFDPAVIGYEDLVRRFFTIHDPTQLNRQGPDTGTQYRSVIFYHDEDQKRIAEKVRDEFAQEKVFKKRIVTEIVPAEEFYKAEEYHQRYYEKNKRGSCAF